MASRVPPLTTKPRTLGAATQCETNRQARQREQVSWWRGTPKLATVLGGRLHEGSGALSQLGVGFTEGLP